MLALRKHESVRKLLGLDDAKESGSREAVEAVFNKIDTDESASLTLEELNAYVKPLLPDASEAPPPAIPPPTATTPEAPPPEAPPPEAPPEGGAKMQSAFVFVKPHANVEAVCELVKKKFGEVGVSVLSDGTYDGSVIDANKYIDQHYFAIASKATIKKPAELNVPADKFADFFGEDWETVKAENRTFNALDLQTELGLTPDALEQLWDATNADNKTRIKFGGGFYCGMITVEDKKYYTFNAFFMRMRGKFTEPGKSIHYFVVEFDPSVLSWSDFRGKVLGPTNPAEAPADSLRGLLYSGWESLGLAAAPDTGDNGVHASASPFEGLAERTNWLASEYSLASDPFGSMLIAEGIPETMLKEWCVDPQVTINADGKKGSIFDQLEDLDLGACIAKCKELAAMQ